jgi:HD-GYP domain-containing protein (c-di-GMP phosphodiesterase class II)
MAVSDDARAARPPRAGVRLAELVASLSLGIDLGFGQPMEHVLRQCLIALAMADRLGLDDDDRSVVYFTALLVNVGCHADAHEQAKWFGDDIAMRAAKYDTEMQGVRGATSMMRMLGAGHPTLQRFRIGLEFAVSGRRDFTNMIAGHAAMAAIFAEQLGLPDAVVDAMGSSYEQWDGKGWPGERRGDEIPVASRVSLLAEYMEVAHRVGGTERAQGLAAERRGAQFDPELADMVITDPAPILDPLDSVHTWDAVIAAEPSLGVSLSDQQFEAALLAVANFIDLKSPYTLGHARAVADLTAAAAPGFGIDDHDRTLRRAALVHGFGRLGVSNSIWDKRGPLGAGEWERVRLTPYLTGRMLDQSPTLAPLSAIAVQHRERLDGSGYPRGLKGSAISAGGRLLAVADAYQSMTERRPHRDALSPDAAAAELQREASAGRLDRDAVTAVLGAAGHRVPSRTPGPAGLTAREVEVLRLLAGGLSSKEIATRLVISPKTARNHIEHIYTKIGTSTRVGASLFAVNHGLVPDLPTVDA